MERTGKSIILIGMMGAGKSSVGRCLQKRTGLDCLDTDELVEARAGMSIPDIFSRHGEARFRDVETEVLMDLAPGRPAIVVTGGGIVVREANGEVLKQMGMVVWLEADEATLLQRASRRGDRPLLQTEDPGAIVSELLHARTPLYAKAADFRVDTTHRTHDEVCDVILDEIETRNMVAP